VVASSNLEYYAPRLKGVRPSLKLVIREDALTVHRDQLEWIRFDLGGRWRVALLQGLTYRRALSGCVIQIRYYLDHVQDQDEEGFHEVQPVSPARVDELHAIIREHATQAFEVFAAELPAFWRRVLELARDTGADEHRADGVAFRRAYVGEPITPPDQRDAILLQSTTGCAHNSCTFCVFYRGVHFSIRTAPAFERHVEQVRSFLGPTLSSRHRIFFGDASALMVKPSLLARHFESARSLLSEHDWGAMNSKSGASSGPYSAFCDTFLTPLPSTDTLNELAHLGLGRVYLGIESGAPEVLGLLEKPATPEGMLDAVHRLKQAGITVAAIVMVGVGGKQFSLDHLQGTIRLLKQMTLGPGDLIQFSEFFCMPGSAYERDAAELGLEPMSRMDCRKEIQRMMEALGMRQQSRGGIHIQMYDARQLVY
jgi:hypothetical protein